MKDFANRKQKRNNIRSAKTIFRSKRKIQDPIPFNAVLLLIITALTFVLLSFVIFKTNIKPYKPATTINEIKFSYDSDLQSDNILIEAENNLDFFECTYIIQVETFGQIKYAYETIETLDDFNNLSIDKITSNNIIYHRVLSGPYANKSDANNAKETIVKRGFSPLLRTKCS